MPWTPPAFDHRLSRLLAVSGMLAICIGASSQSCSVGSDGSDGDRPSFVTELSLQDLDLQVTDSFERGGPITLVLTVRNRLDTSVEVDFPSARTFDFVVVRQNTDDVVWQWSDGRTFSQVATTLTFAPGETKTFSQTWEQRGSSGEQVRRDSYEARGVLVYAGFDTNPLRSNQLGSTLIRFDIR
jgi:hypothetical protein